MQLICKKCGYTWEYAGNKHRTSCSKCKTSITIYKLGHIGIPDLTIPAEPKTITVDESKMQLINQSIQIPLKLLDSLAFSRAKAWAKTNGEDYITLKPNSEGILSL